LLDLLPITGAGLREDMCGAFSVGQPGVDSALGEKFRAVLFRQDFIAQRRPVDSLDSLRSDRQ
jgi:hypothetical protein